MATTQTTGAKCNVDENGWCHTYNGYMSNCPKKPEDTDYNKSVPKLMYKEKLM